MVADSVFEKVVLMGYLKAKKLVAQRTELSVSVVVDVWDYGMVWWKDVYSAAKKGAKSNLTLDSYWVVQ